jgi:hypothetical protein
VLIIAGAWLEGLSIACEVAKINPNDEMNERIGEQKIIFSNIMMILNLYNHIPYFEKLTKDFSELKSLYDQVEIKYIPGESEMIEINGELVIVDSSTSEIVMSNDLRNNIISTVAKIRSGLIN